MKGHPEIIDNFTVVYDYRFARAANQRYELYQAEARASCRMKLRKKCIKNWTVTANI